MKDVASELRYRRPYSGLAQVRPHETITTQEQRGFGTVRH